MNALDVLTSTPLVHPHTVRKRDGRTTQPFDIDKITNAVRKAWQEVAADVDEGVALRLDAAQDLTGEVASDAIRLHENEGFFD